MFRNGDIANRNITNDLAAYKDEYGSNFNNKRFEIHGFYRLS